MLNIICMLAFTIDVGGVNVRTSDNVEGTLLAESNVNYLVDFREGLKGKAVSPENYKHIVIKKTECVKR